MPQKELRDLDVGSVFTYINDFSREEKLCIKVDNPKPYRLVMCLVMTSEGTWIGKLHFDSLLVTPVQITCLETEEIEEN